VIGVLTAVVLAGAAGFSVWALRAHPHPSGLAVEWRAPVVLGQGARVRDGRIARAAPWRVVDLELDLARVELRVARPAARGGGRLTDMLPPGALAAVNGGYFDETYRPVGWLVDRGVEIAPRSARTSGGVLAVKGAALFMGPARQVPFAPEFVLQNGPRLIESGGRLGIRTDDGKRAPRTVACDAGGRLHLYLVVAALRDGPTLYETARMLAALGCERALNLDGGPSTGFWLHGDAGVASAPPPAPIAYAVAVLPR